MPKESEINIKNMKTLIYIIRHGQSTANINKVFAGNSDFFLTDLGLEQAKITAKVLEKVPFSKICSSPLARARKTADAQAKMHHLPVILENDLKEIFCGEWEAQPHEVLKEKYPDLFPGKWENEFGTVEIPGGEGIIEAGKRFSSVLSRIGNENQGKSVCVVTHAGILRSFWGQMLGLAPGDIGKNVPYASNASYSLVVYENGIFTPIIYSEDSELQKSGIATHISYEN